MGNAKGETMSSDFFQYNERLGIPIPILLRDWTEYSQDERLHILYNWEQIRGSIPTRILQLESQINGKQAQLNQEENFEVSCLLNSEIAELASCINDLHLWYRANQELEESVRHG